MERRIKGDVKPTRSNSSNRWMHEHVTDPFVQQAKKLGYRSRSSFKIIEIDEKYKLFQRGMTVVDLGAAPGGWSQIAAPRVGAVAAPNERGAPAKARSGQGRVIAIDLLDMAKLPGVQFLQADFATQEGLLAVVNCLGGPASESKAAGKAAAKAAKVGLVMSDMSPNISGIGVSDQAKSMYLCEIALEFAAKFLELNGVFVVKTFQGSGFTEFLKEMRATFRQVKTIKPKASRDRSSETYLVGIGLREAPQ